MATTELTVKITPNDKGDPTGKPANVELLFTAETSRRTQADWILDLGAPQRLRSQRQVPSLSVLRKRRAPQLRASVRSRIQRPRTASASSSSRPMPIRAYWPHNVVSATLAPCVLELLGGRVV
jgi:hypothetical protein